MHDINISYRRPARKHKASGFSIVEVLVAGALLGIAVIAVVAVVQKSGDLQAAGSKRIAARMFLATQFEKEYGAGKYAWAQPHDTAVIFGDTVNGDGTEGHYVAMIGSINNIAGVPYKPISLMLAWTDLDNTPDTITLTKWLAE